MSRTFHIYFADKGWTVRREGSKPNGVFPTQKEAIEIARAVAKKAAPSQVVLHGKSGTLRAMGVYGMPPIQEPSQRSPNGKLFEKAISKLALERLTAGDQPSSA
jgi:Uncharacterized protein conserved in bacteria (DUF2188)